MLDFIFTWTEAISCVMWWVFHLHLYSPVLKWVIVGLWKTSYTARLGAWSMSVSLFLLFCCRVFFCRYTYSWPFTSHLQLLELRAVLPLFQLLLVILLFTLHKTVGSLLCKVVYCLVPAKRVENQAWTVSYNAKSNLHVSHVKYLVLAFLQAFLKPHSYAFLPVTGTADKRVTISKRINNNVWLHAYPYSLTYRKN